MAKFSIHVTNPPGRIFFPGSEVSGDVTVIADQPKKYKSIQASLFGCGYVGYEAADVEEATCLIADEVYVHLSNELWKREDSPSHKIPAGHHVFPFRFTLPLHIPPSFSDKRGAIHYYVEARISTGGIKYDQVIKATIRVAVIVDINSSPRLQLPVHKEKNVIHRSLSCVHSPINVSVGLPRQGYCIGECVPVNAMIENQSGRQLSVRASLYCTVTYSTPSFYYQWTKTLASSSCIVPKRSNSSWSPVNLKIPLSEPGVLLYSRIIKVTYLLQVDVSVRFSVTHLCVKVPLTIGNVALQEALPQTGQWLSDPPPSYEEALREPAMYTESDTPR